MKKYTLHIKSCRAFKPFEYIHIYECANVAMLVKAIRAIAQKWYNCKCWFEDEDGKQLAYGYCNIAKQRYTYTANDCIFEGGKA